MSAKLFSCVISCYNEEENILALLKQVKVNNLGKDVEFIIVNNGSTDKSWDVISKIKNDFEEIIFINLNENLGWGNGIVQGLKHVSCDYVGWTHGDLQYDLKSLLQVKELLSNPINKNENTFIKGRRKNRKFSDRIFTNLMSLIATIFLGKILIDINAQPNFFSKKVLENFKNTPKDLMLDLYLYYIISKKKNKRIIRIPVTQDKRKHGISSWNKGFFSKIIFCIKMFIGIIKVRL